MKQDEIIKVLKKSWEIINSAIPETYLQEEADKNLEDIQEIIHFLEGNSQSSDKRDK